jgi:glycosyltransferase involved in cell wall biosynthesis
MPESSEPSSTPGAIAVSVVMPVYNEKDSIQAAVEEIEETVMKTVPNCELIVVESSKDGTRDILDRLAAREPRLKVIHQPPRGHGPALIAGLDAAAGQYIFMVDGDQQIPLSAFDSLWQAMPGNDAVFGIRTKRQDPPTRLVLTKIVRYTLGLSFGVKIKDANVPFKLIRREVWRDASGLIPKEALAPSIFLALFAVRRGYKVVYVPVPHRERQAGEGTIRHLNLIKACYKAFLQLLSFRQKLMSERQKVR